MSYVDITYAPSAVKYYVTERWKFPLLFAFLKQFFFAIWEAELLRHFDLC